MTKTLCKIQYSDEFSVGLDVDDLSSVPIELGQDNEMFVIDFVNNNVLLPSLKLPTYTEYTRDVDLRIGALEQQKMKKMVETAKFHFEKTKETISIHGWDIIDRICEKAHLLTEANISKALIYVYQVSGFEEDLQEQYELAQKYAKIDEIDSLKHQVETLNSMVETLSEKMKMFQDNYEDLHNDL